MNVNPMGPGFFIFFQEHHGSYGASPDLLNITLELPEFGEFKREFEEVFGEEVKEDLEARELKEPIPITIAFPTILEKIKKEPKKAKRLAKRLGIKPDEWDLELIFLFILLSED